ncbi:hypothetical protein PFDSM3638_04815 [Pyrococcus furiosus DSM 3638]|uniref:Uncharacterized protein n=2 Tax=Pyrococcus furiosus TaxID=2261 RepID=A0A5C0XN97_PYRFU|nr:hypothetical protein [Pyrococcus furiosus]AFN03755.1 hypothetical protein PFC_04030 [Pyrococcus furiosus COM1]QEK78626.1 hypothetical protein PFDSM3638_04815 [Pyrococcus furiosus DSM 3638]
MAQRVAKRKYGIGEDLIDYYALVDTNLTFEENIKNIAKIIGKAEKVRKAKDQLIKAIMEFKEYWETYGKRDYAVDKAKKARKVFDLEKATLKQLELWLRHPERYDIKQIDYPGQKRKRKKN